MSGSDILNTPKGQEFLDRLDAEIENMTKQWTIKNRKCLHKDLQDAIQKHVDAEIKPKIQAQNKLNMAPGEEGLRYEFRDLKTDLEDMKELFVKEYPSELVYQKVFEVTFDLAERLHLVSKQAVVSAEMLATETLKRTQEDYQSLKQELTDERSISRDKTVEQDTMLIKLQSEQAVLQEKLNSSKRELQSKVEQIQAMQAQMSAQPPMHAVQNSSNFQSMLQEPLTLSKTDENDYKELEAQLREKNALIKRLEQGQ
jgi:hypothetical protein